ncbi:PAN domain-containing protein At5g03700 [Diospyros lotus]|uniref:PAN domain-containing protein At5g03700 n=1 Tax=Diospyros lotus TaxID=55363 RepID=UPI00224E87BA|nr:PAN domain-containing protein At5g03700 [Diospyros lotus]
MAVLLLFEMKRQPTNSMTRFPATQLFCTAIFVLFAAAGSRVSAAAAQELLRGFTASPDPSGSSFQSLLRDTAGNYSLGFLRVNRAQLALAVIHVPSSEALWVANPTRLPRWSKATRVLFNGSLVISDPQTGVFWSTQTDGDRVWLNTSNLEIQKLDASHSILWQSFYFPSDTLVENQNFTSTMSLVSSNGLYCMRLGSDFIGLYANFNQASGSGQIYWKHRALEAKADVIDGQGPIYLVLSPDGFLGMYQNRSVPVDVQSFSSFQQRGSGARRVRLEPDGNLRGYFWTGSSWVLDYQAIPDSDQCELPSACGSYGLCQQGKGCSCIDNRTDYNSGHCSSSENNSGDFCGQSNNSKYRVVRRNGLELPYKDLMGFEKMGSQAQCEEACENNCTCWGVVYTNSSGFCYTLSYPIQTLVAVGDETKVGYFKVAEGAGKKEMGVGYGVGIGFLCVAVLSFLVLVGFVVYRLRMKKRGHNGYMEEEENGVGVGPYKDLGSASFRSIELCQR